MLILITIFNVRGDACRIKSFSAVHVIQLQVICTFADTRHVTSHHVTSRECHATRDETRITEYKIIYVKKKQSPCKNPSTLNSALHFSRYLHVSDTKLFTKRIKHGVQCQTECIRQRVQARTKLNVSYTHAQGCYNEYIHTQTLSEYDSNARLFYWNSFIKIYS